MTDSQAPTTNGSAPSSTPAPAPTKSKKESKPGKKGPPSAEEIEAIRAARAAKKEREALAKQQAKLEADKAPKHLDAEGNRIFVPREWAKVKGCEERKGRRVRIGSWNILAQGLVRRKLFPGSDALRWKDREAGLKAEMVAHSFDVAALQEVDRLDAHGPNLSEAGYAYVYEKGFSAKQHGLLLAWKKDVFGEEAVGRKLLFFDQLAMDEGKERPRLAISRVTRNIGSLVALRFVDAKPGGPKGIIVGTTHTWWHPQFGYERSRQAGLLVREIRKWQAQQGAEWCSWPAFVAGDFNDQPHSATYHLLTGRELTQHCRTEIAESSVVHQSVDEKREALEAAAREAERGDAVRTSLGDPKSGASSDASQAAGQDDGGDDDDDEEAGDDDEEEEEEEEAGQADDRLRKNCRRPTPNDGLLSVDELRSLHSGEGKGSVRSAYALAYDNLDPPEADNFFGSANRGKERHDDEGWTRSEHVGFAAPEPMWTIFSPLFHLTLDYVFLLPLLTASSTSSSGPEAGIGGNEPSYPRVTALLRTHKTEVLEEGGGLPRKGLCCSDHVAIGAEVEL